MKKFTKKITSALSGIACSLLVLIGTIPITQAQSISTTSQFLPNNGYGGTVFNFENTNSYPVMIDAIEAEGTSTGSVVYKLFYNLTPVSGQPAGAIVNNPDWIEAHAQVSNYTSASVQQEVMNNIGLEIPANTTVGLAVLGFLGSDVNSPGGGHQAYYTIPTGTGTVTFSDAGCNLLLGENISYGFTSYTTTSYNHPRGFVGTINFFPVSQTPCTGTPDAGSITGPTEKCGASPFQLSIPYPLDADMTIQWQSSPSGQNNWSNITGVTGANYNNTAGINADTDYRVIVTCTNSNQSDTTAVHTVDLTPANQCYCIPPAPSIGGLYWIDGVITTGGLNNINNTGTGAAANGYADYSGTHSVSTFSGGDFDLEIQSQNGASVGVKVWIDWNKNGTFEASELVYSSTAGSSSSLNTYNANIQVPVSVTPGTTRMRIRNYTGQEPCNQLSYGETEDYEVMFISLANCSAADAGTISSNKTDVCADENFTLTATGATSPGTGLTYQWQSSPAGANTWTDITNANSLSYTGTGVTGDTDFRLKVTCSFGNLEDISNVVTVDETPANQCYCTPPPPTYNTLYWIENVSTTGGINNISNLGTGFSPGGYADYNGIHNVTTFAGGDFDLEMHAQSGGAPGIKVWIDWNMNGVFEASELVYNSTAGSSSTLNVYNTNIQVPANVTPGTTRMRIRNYTGQEPCNQVSYGEAEDYEVVFITLANCSDADAGTISSNKTQVCADENFTLSTTGATSPGTGLTYQWQSSPAGANTWTDIAGANSMNYTGTGVTGETDFRLKVNCSFGNLEDISNVVTVDASPATDCYCMPSATSGEYLSHIGIETDIDDHLYTVSAQPINPIKGYDDQSNITIMTYAGDDVEVNTTYVGGSNTVKIWVDWNQNGVFEANELMAEDYTSGASQSFSFQVPAGAAAGDYRIRTRARWSTTVFTPCDVQTYGSAVDFTLQLISLANCTDANAGTIASNKTQVCSDEDFVLTTTGATGPGTGLTYQWQSSPAGANTWSDIANANSTNYTGTGVTGDTDFRLKVTCSFGNLEDLSNVVTVDQTPANLCYCIPPPPSISGLYWIDAVSTTGGVINFSNTGTGASANGYMDYSSTHSVTSIPGGIFDIEVQSQNGATPGIKIWIDWNQNGTFESNELVYNSSAGSSSSLNTYIANINVPSNAVTGVTKMRIRNYSNQEPCNLLSYGEAEDYGVEILIPTPCAGTPTASALTGVNSICPNIEFTINGSGIAEGGIVYQWQSSPAGANTWADIAGANNPFYNATNGISNDTDYRMIVTCTNSNQSDTTAVHSITVNPPGDCYCTPEYNTDCSVGDDLSNVKLAGETVTLENPTTCSPNGYADFRGLVDEPDLLVGETYTIELSTSYGSPQFEDVRAWIDWNQNGIFEPGEEIANTMGNGMGTGTYTETFTVPAGTPNGLYTMRARLVYSGGANIDPCDLEYYGEAQDYYVIVGTLCDDPIVDLGPDVTICAGSSVTLDAGNPGLEYEWSNNATTQTITVTQAGTYTVTVYDGDCSTTDSITVTVQDLPLVDLGNDKTICDGDVITLDADNAGADFLWSDNSTGQTLDVNQAGTYHVTVTEGVCSASDTVNVDYYPEPTAGGIIVTEQGECTFTFSVDNPSNVDYFEWNFGDGTIPTIGPLASHTYTAEGQFTVTLTLKNECDDEVQFTYVVFCEGVGIEDLDAGKNAITLYPNPTTERITLESSNNAVMESITVYNVLGQVVYENATVNATEHIVDVAQLASGVYTVRIQTNQGYTTRKFEIIK